MPSHGKGWSALRRARARDTILQNYANNKENCQQSPGLPEATNDLPCTSSVLLRLLDREKVQKGDYKRQLHNERRKLGRAKDTEVTMRLKVLEAESSLEEVREDLARAEGKIDGLKRDKNKLRMRTSRANNHVSRVVEAERVSSLKENGVIRDAARNMVRELASLNVPVEHVAPVIDAVAKGIGTRVTDSLGPRSVGRIVLEGKIAADIQLIHEMRTAKSKYVNLYILPGTNCIP